MVNGRPVVLKDEEGLPNASVAVLTGIERMGEMSGAILQIPRTRGPEVIFSPDGQLAAVPSADGSVHLIDAATRAHQATLPGGSEGPVGAGAFSQDGRWVAVGFTSGIVRIWDCRSGQQLTELRGHEGGVTATSFSPDGRRLITGGADRAVRIWDVPSGYELLALREPAGRVLSVGFSADGSRIHSSEEGREITWERDARSALASSGQYAALGGR
jgi:WD40 repeat protein